MIDTNDDGVYGQLDIASDIGESGTYTYDSELSNGELESTTCDLRDLYFEVRVTDGSGTVFDSKKTQTISEEWYDCEDGNCASNRSNHL